MSGRLITSLLEIPQPEELLEMGGIQEVYADFAIPQPHGEVVRILLCRQPITTGHLYEVTGMVVLPLAGYLRSHTWSRAIVGRLPRH